MRGLIFIPDISGFTDFVRNTNIDLGVEIMHQLLSEIIESNPLELQLSEIEGDAILFYKEGYPISLNEIFTAFNTIYESFNRRYQELKLKHGIKLDLSLKFIVHYGEMNIYYIKGFKKLYGQMIIESHRLLKNGSGNSNYILITDDYMKALRSNTEQSHSALRNLGKYSSQLFSGLREIGYYFFNHSSCNSFPVMLPYNERA